MSIFNNNWVALVQSLGLIVSSLRRLQLMFLLFKIVLPPVLKWIGGFYV